MCCLFFPINVFFYTKTVSTMHRWFLQHFGAILKSGGSTAIVIEAFYFLRLASLQIVCMVYSFFWLYKMTLRIFLQFLFWYCLEWKSWKTPNYTESHHDSNWHAIIEAFLVSYDKLRYFILSSCNYTSCPRSHAMHYFFQDRYSCTIHRYSL